jgi:hypothetical protein
MVHRVPKRGRSKLVAVRGGKKAVAGRSNESPRRMAHGIRAWSGAHKRGDSPRFGGFREFQKPKRGRRKLGARRKITLIQTLFRWIRVPTGKVSRRSRRR